MILFINIAIILSGPRTSLAKVRSPLCAATKPPRSPWLRSMASVAYSRLNVQLMEGEKGCPVGHPSVLMHLGYGKLTHIYILIHMHTCRFQCPYGVFLQEQPMGPSEPLGRCQQPAWALAPHPGGKMPGLATGLQQGSTQGEGQVPPVRKSSRGCGRCCEQWLWEQ